MSTFDPQSYGPVFAPLVAGDRRRSLGAGRADRAMRAALEKLTVETAFEHARVVDIDAAACSIAGVWLLHDFLSESHAICQDIDTPEGSYWHAIMHRREGDFGNAKYWFRRVGHHPVLDHLGQRAAEFAAARGAERGINKLITGGEMNPGAFVDLCQSVSGDSSPLHELCLDVQQAEWELLFAHCYQLAIGIDASR